MRIECQFQERTSKAGNNYFCLYIPEIEKVVLLEPAEIKLLQVLHKNDNK